MNDVTTMSAADFANLDLGDFEEVRYEVIPQGVYGFKIITADMEEGDNRDGDPRIVITFECEIVEVLSTIKFAGDPESLVGKKQSERFFVNILDSDEDKAKAVGRMRAFLSDVGAAADGSLGDAIQNAVETTFHAKITHRKDREDPSVVYTSMRFDKKK